MRKTTKKNLHRPRKSINQSFSNHEDKRTSQDPLSSVDKRPVWNFSNIDKDGLFAFNPRRTDFNSQLFLLKLLDYSSMTWREILQQTHDDNKSKNHYLSPDSLSPEAVSRIKFKHFEDKTDNIFSFALNNISRLIGFKDDSVFHVVWYDSNHQFAPSHKKHT